MDGEERFLTRESPCRHCEDHRPGCHTPECPHGWQEWHDWQQKRAEEIRRQKWLDSRLSRVCKKKSRGQRPAKAIKAMAKNGGLNDDTMRNDS